MKNAIIYCVVSILVHANSYLNAQTTPFYSNNNYNYMLYKENHAREENKKNGLQEKKIINEKNAHVQILRYDKDGRAVNYFTDKKKEVRASYTDGDKKKFLALYKNGKLVWLDSFIWEKGNLMKLDIFNSRSKLIKRESYKYDSTYITQYLYERLRRGKLREHIKRIFEYYPDYSYKKIVYYKNGKPQYYSVFDCNPSGENHKIKSDSSYNCVKYDVDSLGNKIKVTITNKKGYSWKEIEYYNGKDECVARKTYDLKKSDKLLWAYYFKPGAAVFTEFVSYVREKEYYKIENVYDDKNNCTESSTYKHRRFKKKTVNIFNEKGLMINTKEYNKRNKLKNKTRYEYEYY